VSADMAQLCGGIETIYHHHVRAIPASLVLQLAAQSAHGCIGDALRQLGSRKAPNVEILDADRLMCLDERRAHLVCEVGTLVGYMLVDPCEVSAGFSPVAAPLLPTAIGAVGTAQFAL